MAEIRFPRSSRDSQSCGWMRSGIADLAGSDDDRHLAAATRLTLLGSQAMALSQTAWPASSFRGAVRRDFGRSTMA
jgi:hypothetical protein